MARRIGVLLIGVITLVAFLYCAQAQTREKNWKKTITLPNGEAVLDMNGEWDAVSENYGAWDVFGTHHDVFKITQEGNFFVAIRMMGNPYMPAGTTGTRGELDKNGFKKVLIVTFTGPIPAKGQISEDGNKIVIDEGEVVRQTLIRK
jgi:hypothetical protein